jgi:hypothetical protein
MRLENLKTPIPQSPSIPSKLSKPGFEGFEGYRGRRVFIFHAVENA